MIVGYGDEVRFYGRLFMCFFLLVSMKVIEGENIGVVLEWKM